MADYGRIWTQEELAALYPDGRTYYNEGDFDAFRDACHKLDLCVQVHYAPPSRDLDPWATVDVPAHRHHAFLALGLVVGT